MLLSFCLPGSQSVRSSFPKNLGIKTLEDVKACDEAREWFVKTFPKGTTKAKALVACPQGDWLIWALWNFKLATIEQVIMAGCCAGRRSLRFAREQDKAVLVAAFDAADAVADDNNAQTRAAAEAAGAAGVDAWVAEHQACVNDIRKLMMTERYKKAGVKK